MSPDAPTGSASTKLVVIRGNSGSGKSSVARAVRHSGYWDEGSESLRNQARILVGDYHRTTLNRGEAPPEIP